jgi:hypothetical protein
MKFNFLTDRKKVNAINAIVNKVTHKYNKAIIKAANLVRTAHKNNKSFWLAGYLAQNRRTIEGEARDEIEKLELTYPEKADAGLQVLRNLDDIDKKYFGHPQIPNMWDWVNGNNNWKKLLGENKIIKITKSQLKEIIREVILKENNDKYDM